MAVYVDKLMPCSRRPDWPWPYACHLFADTLDELHAMADKLCLAREWFQDRPNLPHYDLTPSMRKRAIYYGTVACNNSKTKEVMRRHREAAEAARDGR